MAAGPQVEDVAGWRVGLLLMGFATVTFLLEKVISTLEHRLRKRKGLLLALRSIKNELLYLGAISLLLSAFQVCWVAGAATCRQLSGRGARGGREIFHPAADALNVHNARPPAGTPRPHLHPASA